MFKSLCGALIVILILSVLGCSGLRFNRTDILMAANMAEYLCRNQNDENICQYYREIMEILALYDIYGNIDVEAFNTLYDIIKNLYNLRAKDD